MKIVSIKLYQYVGFDIDAYIDKYLHAISKHDTSSWAPSLPPNELLLLGHITEDELEEEMVKYNTFKITHHRAKRGVKSPDIIKCKVQYIQDIIIRRSISNAGEAFSLNSQVLKNIIGDEYKTMLHILVDMGYLHYGDGHDGQDIEEYMYYQIGRYSRIYSIPHDKEVENIWITNAKIQSYKEKEQKQIYQFITTEVHTAVDKRYGKEFSVIYEKSLCKITLEQPEELDAYIPTAIQRHIEKDSKKRRKKKKSMIEHYYNYVKTQLLIKDKHIQRIDNAGRIYHVLTNTDRNIKQFLNIAISADCKNRHSVLFNYFIFRWRGVSLGDAYTISSLMHKVPAGSNIRQNLIRDVPNHVLDLLADDELNYIYQTTNGVLWDNIASKHPDIDRHKVKENMFAEVFYSNDIRTYKWQEYAQEFRAMFPNVSDSLSIGRSQRMPLILMIIW